MKKLARAFISLTTVVAMVLVLSGSNMADAPFKAILLWESAAIDAPEHSRHAPLVLAVKDVTGDGITDVVACIAEHVTIYAGDGEGSFELDEDIALTNRIPMAANPWPHFVPSAGAVEDLDGDGRAEILVGGDLIESASSSRSVAFLLETNDEQYAVINEFSCSGPPQRMAVFRDSSGTTSLWLSNTAETGEQVQRLTLQAGDVIDDQVLLTLNARWYVGAFGDINEDGYLDVIATHIQEGVEIHFGNEAGALETSIRVTDLKGISFITSADINGDGQQELVGSGTIGIAVIPAPWPAVESQITVYDLGLSVRETLVADFNNDLILDVMAVADRGQRVLFLAGGSSGSFASAQTFIPSQPVGWQGNPLIANDLNNDGPPDVVLGTQYGLRVMMNGGHEPWGTCQLPFGGDKLLAIGDVDQDGDIDIVTQGSDGLDVLWNRDGILTVEANYISLAGQWCKTARVSESRLYTLSTQQFTTRVPDRIWLSVFDFDRNLIARHLLTSEVLPVLAFGDLDNDGEEDVFGTHDGQMWIAWGGTSFANYDVGANPSLVVAVSNEHGGQDAVVVSTSEYADIVRVSFPDRKIEISKPLLQLLSVPFAMTSTDWDGDGKLDAFFVAMKYAVALEEGAATSTVVVDGADWGVVTSREEVFVRSIEGFPEQETVTPFVDPWIGELDGRGLIELAYTTTSSSGVHIHSIEKDDSLSIVLDKAIGPLLAGDLDGNGVDELVGSTLGMFPVVWIQWNGGRR